MRRVITFAIVLMFAAGQNAAWLCGPSCEAISTAADCHQPATRGHAVSAEQCRVSAGYAPALVRDDAPRAIGGPLGRLDLRGSADVAIRLAGVVARALRVPPHASTTAVLRI